MGDGIGQALQSSELEVWYILGGHFELLKYKTSIQFLSEYVIQTHKI